VALCVDSTGGSYSGYLRKEPVVSYRRTNNFFFSNQGDILTKSDDRSHSSVEIIGSDYEPEEAKENSLNSEVVRYVLIVPHRLNMKPKREGINGLSLPSDKEALFKMIAFLDKHPAFDRATGRISKPQVEGISESKQLLEQSACRFLVKNWTLVIRNSGTIHRLQDDTATKGKLGGEYQECNITESAFLIRKKHFFIIEMAV